MKYEFKTFKFNNALIVIEADNYIDAMDKFKSIVEIKVGQEKA
jgi:hypothetical protein